MTPNSHSKSGTKQKTVWITGASSGIGLAMAKKLACQGHIVYISGRNQDTLDQIVAPEDKGSAGLSGKLIALPCDVTDDKAMARVLQDANIESLDTIILSAGTCEYIDLPNLDIEKIRRVSDSNFFGVVNSCIAALPLLRKTAADPSRERPQIIGIGSMSSYVGFPRAEAYGSSKAAMSYFLHSLRCDLNKTIDVTVVYPGFVKTPMTDKNDFSMPFLMEVDEAADIILKKADKRPLCIAFPSRLNLVLHTMQLFPRLWYSNIAARLSRPAEASS
ncbi:MAG: short-subunit dehydrogenase [Pseudohongiellaceae bacterium]|jgi:short-subunit dehydrogenase